MRFEYEGMSLWYGTADAPAPEGPVGVGTELTITVGVQPWNAGNNVEVLYRMNQGSTEHMAARWLRNDSQKKSHYFRAHFPTFRVGDTVEYLAVCRRAGRQVVPPPAHTERFASSFSMIGRGAEQEPGSAPDLQAMARGPRGAIRPHLRPVNGGKDDGGSPGNGGDGQSSPTIDLQGLQVLGTLVLVGDNLDADRVVLARFEDDASSHTALINWGDGTAETSGEVVSDRSDHFLVIGSHRYSRPGEFVITLRITRGDATLAVATASALVGSKNRRFAAHVFQRLVGHPMKSNEEPPHAGKTRESILRAILASRAFRVRAVTDIYAQLLGRQPDAPELDRSIKLIAPGTTLPLKASIASSNEYFEKLGSTQAENFAYALYSDLLGRAPLRAEVADTARLANDASTRLELVEWLLQSAEGRAQLAQTIARQYANRAATPQELVAAISAQDLRDNDLIVRTFNLQTQAFPGDPDGLAVDAVADFALQFVTPILSPDQVVAFTTQVQMQLAQQFPAAKLDVRPSTENAQTLIAAWLTPKTASNDADRQAWMTRTADLVNQTSIVTEGGVGFFASLNFLKQAAQAVFAASPHRLNAGNTLLTGIDVSLDPNSKTVRTHISGMEIVQIVGGFFGSLGIRFTQHLNDTLGGTKIETDCGGTPFQVIDIKSSTSLEGDEGDEASAILLGAPQIVFPILAIGEGFALFDLPSGGQGPTGGVGAGFVNSLPCTQLVHHLVQGSTPPVYVDKIAFKYTSPDVEATGLTVQAHIVSASRTPSVQIAGLSFIPLFKFGFQPPGSTLRQQYSIQPCDLRSDAQHPLPVIWTTPDRFTVIESPNLATTYVHFSTPSMAVGSTTTRTLHVKVGPDLEGAVQETTLSVFIEVFERVLPPPGHGPPHFL
jgi:Domain of unknown function (DUF4214)